MSIVEPGSAGDSLITRIRNILTRPDATWDVIEAEVASTEGLYKGWVLPLAAIPPVCGAIASLALGGIHLFGVRYEPSLVVVLAEQLSHYLLTLAEVFLLAVFVDLLAPSFGGVRGHIQAMKLTAYSGTALWAAGLFKLLPAVGGLLWLFGWIYSGYLFHLGLSRLMKSDPARTTGYFVACLVVALILAVLIGSVTERITDMAGPLSVV